MICYGLIDILRQRAGQCSFHTASEKALRIEFMRFKEGQGLGPLNVDGDVVVTCLEGSFVIGADRLPATSLTQVIVPQGESLVFFCTSGEGAVQLIWAPPFAAARPG